jgi:hypothetical protein
VVAEVHACSSASPTLLVVALTDVTVSLRLVVSRGVKATVVALPSSASAGTATDVPSEKVSVPPVMRSLVLGRSNSTALLSVTGEVHVSVSVVPAPPPVVAHSLV